MRRCRLGGAARPVPECRQYAQKEGGFEHPPHLNRRHRLNHPFVKDTLDRSREPYLAKIVPRAAVPSRELSRCRERLARADREAEMQEAARRVRASREWEVRGTADRRCRSPFCDTGWPRL